MKALLVGEYRKGRLLENTYEAVAFARRLGAEFSLFLVGDAGEVPAVEGKVYLADAKEVGEFNPAAHKALVLEAVEREKPDLVVFAHSSYGWDLAPRVALALEASQISEVIGIEGDNFLVPCCNAKMRRVLHPETAVTVVTLQAGAFPAEAPSGTPDVIALQAKPVEGFEFLGYEEAEKADVDLGKAEVIVSAGRGVGKKENISLVQELANALGGEYGASRPVVDGGWADHARQVGTTGQSVSPKLYVACGISGAIQHLAGMKKSDFIVAVNTDKDAPIGEVADVLVVADLKQFLPALTEKIKSL